MYIPERSNGANYLESQLDAMMPTVREVYPEEDVREIVLIQDNCWIHRCRLVSNWIQQQRNLRTSRSPDLDPIDNYLWAVTQTKTV